MRPMRTKSDRKMEDGKWRTGKWKTGKWRTGKCGTDRDRNLECLIFLSSIFLSDRVSCPVGRRTTEQWMNMSDSSSKLLAALFAERRVLSVTEVTEQVK